MRAAIILCLLAATALAEPVEQPKVPILEVEEAAVLQMQVDLLSAEVRRLQLVEAQLRLLVSRAKSWTCEPPELKEKPE